MELPDIDEENAALARTTSAQQQDDLPDIDVENARLQETDLPDIEEENARVQETDLPDIDVENGILAQKSQTTQTPAVQTTQPTATVEQQPTPAEQQPDTHWQEMDERARQFNLGDAIYAAGEHVVEGLKGARDVIGSVANPVLKLVGDAAQGLGNLSAHGVVMPNGIAIGERGELGGNKLTPDELAVKRRNNIGTAVGSSINEGVDTIFPNEPNDNPVTAKIQKVGNEIGGLLRFTIGNAAALGAAEYGPTWNADYDAYLKAGKTPAEAAAWADLGGITNAIFAMALKGIPVGHYVKKMFGWELPENLLKEAIDKAGTLGMKEVKAAMTKILAGQLFKNAVTEAGVLGGVSAAQTAATGAIQQLGTTGKIDAAALGEAALESGLHGAATGATMGALPIAVKIPEARKGAEEPIRTAQEMRAAANASRFTPEQRTTLNMRIPEFVGEDAEMTGRVMDRISEKMADEAINGTPEGKTPLRERLDDPAEMEIEIQKATEELLFEDNAAEVAKSVNTKSLGTKAADRATEIATAMPRTADKTESRIAGEIAAADPDMDAERVWEVAEYLAAHGEAASSDGQPLTKERIAEVEKAMIDDKAGVVPVEQPDGTFKTVNEVEAEAAREERKSGLPETQTQTLETPAPALQMKPVDHSADWAPVSGKTGVFHTAEFPEVEIALQDAQPGEGTKPDGTPKKIMFIENLPDPSTLDEAGQLKLGEYLSKRLKEATKLKVEEVNIGTPEQAAEYQKLVDKYEQKVTGDKFQVRADSVIGLLKKSGLASDVIATEEEFNAKLASYDKNGQRLIADGKTYGFTDGTNVYLNPAFFRTKIGLNTPIHEFGHLAIIATKNVNRAVYDRALTLIKDTGYWKEVSEHPDYAALPDWKKAEEALTRLIAERGERLEATTPKGVIAEIKQLLVEIWKSFGNALGLRDLTPEKIEKMTVEDIADAIRAEMSSGREFGTRELSVQEGDLKAKILRFAKYSKPTSAGAKAALEAAKKAWKGLSEEQKVALGRYGDTSVLKTQEARTIANGVRMLREWDARRARISQSVKDQIRRSPNEGQKKIITGSPQYYVSQVTGDVTSPFAFAIDRGLPIPRKGDWGWDAWERLTDGMKHAERRRLEKIIGGEHPKRGGMDTVLSDYAQWLGISWGDGARDFEHGRGIEDFLDDILKERAKFEQWKTGDRKTREENEELRIKNEELNGGLTDEEFAEEDAWVRASETRRIEAERMGEQDDLSDMPDFSRAQQPIMMSRAIRPSALGDGKQKYYEVPFDKAVDKIVKNKKALSDEDVFVSQTPKPFQEIGLAKLPILMNQRHVLSCYFGPGEGVNQHHLHGLHNALKMLPRALEHPLMIIASESRPNDSVVAIVRLRDRNGNQMLAPIEINGVGREGDSRIDAHIASSFFGKKNAWTEMIANALRNEVDGKVSVFYLDSNEAKTIQNRLARDAFNIGRSELQSLSRSNASSTWHSITDAGSPVNGVISDQTQTRQFKDWFGKSKVVDRTGKPRVVYHGTPNGEFTKFDKEMVGSTWDADELGFFFTSAKSLAEDYTKPYFKESSANPHLFQVYLSIQNPLVIDQKWWRENFGRSDIYKHDAIEIWDTEQQTIIDALKKGNYDGVIIKPNPLAGDPEMYVALKPEQIKSATDNIGTFDPTNPDIRFSRGGGARLVGGRTRVAADQDHGERTPGGLAAARELADVRRAPVSQLGARRFLSLDLSSLEELRKIVSKDVRPAHVAKTEAGVARTEGQVARGKVAFWSDTIGVVDHMDKAAEKANLKAHGFFRDEDSNWCAVQSDAAIKAEKSRSEKQLSRQLEALGERRMRGMEPGGQTAERGVFADEVAKVVLAQERRVGGRLGRLQTIGKAVQDAVARMPGMNQADAEWSARRFLDWAYGQRDYSRNMSGKQLTAEMFGKWLVMPRAVEQTAPEWANAIEQTVAADPKLADAFRTLADRRLNGDEYLMRRIRRQMSRQTEEALRKINEEKDENITAGSKWRNFEEMALYGLHDTFAPVYVRMDYMTRVKIKAMKAAIKAASPADRPALKQQLDLYLGDLGQKLNRLELSRTAYERGTINEGSLYHREMVRLENEAHKRWGLTTEDMSFYLDQWRVIETSGRSASFGEDVVQARKALDEMEARLGPEKWHRMQEYGNRFFAIHEKELLELRDDRGILLAEKMFGKAFIDYLRTQTHYVATERTFSVEEMDAIEVARQALRATGASNVDDVISQMFDYAGAKGAGEAIGEKDWTAPMKGSMAAKTEVRGATFKKVDRLQRALRRNQLVLDLREALTFADVEGVHDLARTEGAKFPEGSRYGHINYLENGHKRTLVVPRHIADAFKGDPAKAKWWSKTVRMIHNTWRALIIDYNPAYRPMNLRRNIASVEKNMPGMRETYLKTVLRASFPGAGAVSDLVFDQMVKRIPATAKLFSDHTYFYFIPQMERILKIIESPSEWQQKYWEAQDANDLGKLSQMDADWDLAKEMLRANMFVSIRSAYANEKSTSFAAEAFAKKGLRTLEEIDRQLKSRDWKRKSVDRLFYLLKKTQQMTEHDDMMAKGIAYLADRKHFGLVRSSQESGDLVNRRVSIAQGERRGAAAGSLKALVPFYNMIEKGVVRHYDAYRTDFGHTLAADAKFVMGSTCSLLMAKGLAQLWMLRDCDNDEKNARKKFGKFYDYAKDYHDAYRNCSDYIRKNYSFTPLWTDGYTSVIFGGALTDEEKLLNPIVDYTVGVMAASEGLEQMPSFGSMVLDSTVRSVIPDLQMTGPLVEGCRLAFSVLAGENYEDVFRGAPAFDQKKVDMRFESLEDFKEYSAVVGGRAWNYFGGRSILSADVYGVDNGRGKAPKSLEAVLSDIPWISPVINRMVKIQVGSPERDGQVIRGRSKEIRQAIDKCAERLLKLREGDKGWHVAHPKEYKEKLAEWQQTYGLSNHDMKVLRADYLNGLNQLKCIEKMDEHKRKLIKREAKRQGCSKEMIAIQLGRR